MRWHPELTARERESLQAGREALCRLLSTAARLSGDQFSVVFDGDRGGGSMSETADHVLARQARG